jgi:hypothetical protein
MHFRIAGLILLLLVLQIPWFVAESGEILGVPGWAAYSVGAAVVFAVVASYLVNRYWDHLSGESEKDVEVKR